MEKEQQRGEVVESVRDRAMSRRVLLRRTMVAGLAATNVAALLAACGGAAGETTSVSPSGTTAPTGPTTSGTAAPNGPKPAGKPGGEMTFGVNLEPDSLDPAVTPYAVSHIIMMNIFDPLLWRGKDGKFYPGLAERWEIATDGKQTTFYLRKGVKFHDGTPFNAEAVKFQLDRTADPATKSGFAANLIGPYERSEVVDEYTVRVFHKGAFAPFLDGMSQAFLGIASPTAVKADPKAFLRKPVGTGPFKFGEWVDKDRVTLAKNPDYNWGPPFFDHIGPTFLDKLSFRFLPEEATRLAALESGDVQIIHAVPTSNLKRIEGERKYRVERLYNPGVPSVMFMNTTKAPTDDRLVRQAIAHAMDRPALIESGTFGTAKPTYGPLGATTPAYTQAIESYYPTDPNKAKQLLAMVGWMPGTDGIVAKGGQKMTLLWTTTPATATYEELIQAQLRAVGIDVQITRATAAATLEAVTKGMTHLSTNSWVSSDPVILTNLFHGKNKNAYAYSKFDDAKLNELLDAGEQTIDEAKRAEIYAQVQTTIMDNALISPLFHQVNSLGYQGKYQGVKTDFRNYPWLYDAFVG